MSMPSRSEGRPPGWFVGALTSVIFFAAIHRLQTAPPLSLEGYLDEKLPEANESVTPSLAANQACYVCHGNFKDDALVICHAVAQVGCPDCHGESIDHRNDENNIIPPDNIFSHDQIDAFCDACHPRHDVPARKVIQCLQERQLTGHKPEQVTCTSCHFKHRLSHRIVRWDKRTGQLLKKTAVPALDAAATMKKENP